MKQTEQAAHLADVLALFREHGELSRTAVMEQTGLSRSTVNQRLATLVERGLIMPTSGGAVHGRTARPPSSPSISTAPSS